MPLVEDLLMLLLDDETGRPEVRSPELDVLLAGAVVADLVLHDVLIPQDDGRLSLRADAALEGSVGRSMRSLLESGAQRPEDVVSALVDDVLEPTVQRLVDQGLVDARPAGGLRRLFKGQRWPATTAGRGDGGLPERLREIAAGRVTGAERDLLLIALLRAAGQDMGVSREETDTVVARSLLARQIGPTVRSALDSRAAVVAATQSVQAATTVVTAVVT